MNTVLKKPSKKYHALARVCNYMNKKKRRILMNAFITFQFSYCPPVWVSHGRTMNNRTNKIHEKVLKLVYKHEKKSIFWWFAEKGQINEYLTNKSKNISDRNL